LRQKLEALVSNLERERELSFSYLRRLEQSGGFLLYLWDRSLPLTFNTLPHHRDTEEMAQAAYTAYAFGQESGTAEELFRREQLPDGTVYDVGVIPLSVDPIRDLEEEGMLLVMLTPRETFHHQLQRERLIFSGISILGGLVLILFSWLFTRRLLWPIRENQRLQTQFIANASHELRTPLSVIRTCISVKPPHFEDAIAKECFHMSKLVDDMLVLTDAQSVGERDKLPCEGTIEPDTLLLEVYEQMESLAKEKGLRITCRLPEEALPTLRGDTGKIRQVLMSILHNAITFTPKGGSIEISAALSGKHLVFRLSDTGIGIPDTEKDKVFERFYRADDSRSDKGHYGLGLSIAREIVLLHHGEISVTNTPGGGSTFICAFPL
jgi:signal transduction histidine kinase